MINAKKEQKDLIVSLKHKKEKRKRRENCLIRMHQPYRKTNIYPFFYQSVWVKKKQWPYHLEKKRKEKKNSPITTTRALPVLEAVKSVGISNSNFPLDNLRDILDCIVTIYAYP